MWERYTTIFLESFGGYGRYLLNEIIHPSWHGYFYGLILVSLAVYGLELLFPWRKNQPRVRKDFWLDAFYMFFNFFLFSLVGYNAVSNVAVEAFGDLRDALGIETLLVFDVATLSVAAQLGIMFVARDFIHYWVHRLLHYVPGLWSFHKVHHSVLQMGFAAHLRFHWMETIVYRVIEYIPLAMIGFGIQEFFAVHLVALTIGHINHANFRPPIGPLRYIFNSPQMHIWHHAKELPARKGANYGLSLSVWDWIFRTVHWPHSGRDIPLGFPQVDEYPNHFLSQMVMPFREDAG